MSVPQDRGNDPWRLLIVDDHPIMRCGLRDLLHSLEGAIVCGEAEDPWSALQAVRHFQPDLVLLDIRLRGGNGIDLIKRMRDERPGIKIVMLSVSDDRNDVRRALLEGAQGYVTKQQMATVLLGAVRVVMAGGLYLSPQFLQDRVLNTLTGTTSELLTAIRSLSPRGYEVFAEIGLGRSADEIAGSLHLSIKSVETHRSHVIRKLQVEDATELRPLASAFMLTLPLREVYHRPGERAYVPTGQGERPMEAYLNGPEAASSARPLPTPSPLHERKS